MKVIGQYGLTLPTEAQWEYAARAGTRTLWWTGNDMDSLRGAVNLADQSAARTFPAMEPIQIWPDLDDGWPWTAPIGQFRANPFGLHDVHGNVWEMVQDGLHSYEYPVRPGDGLRLPPADAPPPRLPHVSRGGACELDAWNARAARRYGGKKFFACGLRPVRLLDGNWKMGNDL
jgi:formylglycine-generating enzyme required for sulfatase activity